MTENKAKKTRILFLNRNKSISDSPEPPTAPEHIEEITESLSDSKSIHRIPNSVQRPVASSENKSKDAEKIKSLESILVQLFLPVANKDGKVRGSALTQTLQSELKRIQQPGTIPNKVLVELAASIGTTDPEFNKLTQVVILTLGNRAVNKVVLDFSVRALSENWVGKHLGNSNLFLAEAEPLIFSNPSILAHLTTSINGRYSKRIDAFKEQLKQKEASNESSSSQLRSLTPEHLRQQCENLLTICYLWAVETGKCDVKIGIQAFKKRILERGDNWNNEKKICTFLASQLSEPKGGIAETLSYYDEFLSSAREKQQSAETINEQLGRKLNKVEAEKVQLMQQVSALQQEIDQLKASISQVKTQSEEQVLDDKALRVHLKDDVSKAKSRAFNLLNEEVMEPLKLSLSALQREKPKVEIAAHQVELVLESIERELEWFKK
ncbi:hypothetical protein ACF3VQ_16555 [Yersinia sp. HM-2024]|uniref:hypothetical protein n=1 Tax=Yersinia TaxID=629 RepID=UPI0005E78569|nr:hypothetical protein [Yersinia frederiksenii]CQI96572.1 Uncharacterised protein [Yersinia frederiksenii]